MASQGGNLEFERFRSWYDFWMKEFRSGLDVRRRRRRLILLGLLGVLVGCSTPNPDVRVRRLTDGRLQVDGPLAGPFKTREEFASRACEIMTRQPGASNGRIGFEYCALSYYAQEEQAFFLSYLSDVNGEKPGGRKFCEVPQALNELGQRRVIVLGPAHTHPHNRELSPEDMGKGREEGWSPLGASRLYDKESERVWERELYAFHRSMGGRCIVYRYNYATRVVSTLREGEWVSIGRVEGRYGAIKMFEGQDWLP